MECAGRRPAHLHHYLFTMHTTTIHLQPTFSIWVSTKHPYPRREKIVCSSSSILFLWQPNVLIPRPAKNYSSILFCDNHIIWHPELKKLQEHTFFVTTTCFETYTAPAKNYNSILFCDNHMIWYPELKKLQEHTFFVTTTCFDTQSGNQSRASRRQRLDSWSAPRRHLISICSELFWMFWRTPVVQVLTPQNCTRCGSSILFVGLGIKTCGCHKKSMLLQFLPV